MGSKARESVEAMSLAFVLLDFQHAGVRRRAQCTRWSVDMQQFREVSRTRTIYSTLPVYKDMHACICMHMSWQKVTNNVNISAFTLTVVFKKSGNQLSSFRTPFPLPTSTHTYTHAPQQTRKPQPQNHKPVRPKV